jgi:hypothetical protein
MSRLLPLLALLLLPLRPAVGAELPWWREYAEDGLKVTPRGVVWSPRASNRELHTHFERVELPAAPGSRLSAFGEITFGREAKPKDYFDTLRIGLFDMQTPTPRDGTLENGVGEGVEFKLNPSIPATRKGSVIKLRTFGDPATTNLVLGAMSWKGAETVHSGFGCAPDTAYPFVIEWERVERDTAMVRLHLNDRSIEQRVTGHGFRANSLAFGRTGSGSWSSLRVEAVGVRVENAGKP